MGIFTGKADKTTTLDALHAKSAELVVREAEQIEASEALAVAAREAGRQAAIAAKHAAAIDSAIKILDDAGVEF